MMDKSLDDAIQHCYDVASKEDVCKECADDHLQLAKWLEDYRRMKSEQIQTFDISGFDSVPEPCRGCSNHPMNGGTGICHCILGTPQIT